ncbi:DEAD/DEAH box helicase [Shewanella sp. JM162201]|uniref:DEAD/DEAH box helicase n=1 Tax=Shewanella jiangmenensis TaxID=2837387 RepID=A0ABS5UYQ2_9GAMM|nr:DEAD/DEAH box helicase [Shewanella jiangmenensis]MBT1443264.1 DEAD/DEAH box helicase [Shewanella jiangmenensis]
MAFSSLGLNHTLVTTATGLGYREPTDIQTRAIPALLEGRDVLAIAQTGSGKTAAFALPIIQLLAERESDVQKQVRALVLVPTRELAEQVAGSIIRYSEGLDLVSLAVYGGVNIRNQVRALERGVDVLVATPGRLWDLISHFGLSLDGVRHLVLDEADRMLDMGFAPDISRIRTRLGEHQSALFSASFAEKEQQLAARWLRTPLTIEAKQTGETPDSLTLELIHLDRRRWAEWLAELVGKRNYQQALVFVPTREGVDALVKELKLDGLRCGAFHGNKTQGARRRALDEFKEGNLRLMVATDVAARGLDIANLPVVISLGMPHSEEDILHRLGRSARAGREGHAIVVLERDDRASLALLKTLCPDLPEAVTPAGYGPKDPLPERYRDAAPAKPFRRTGTGKSAAGKSGAGKSGAGKGTSSNSHHPGAKGANANRAAKKPFSSARKPQGNNKSK